MIERTSEYEDEHTWPPEKLKTHHLDDMIRFAKENVALYDSFEALTDLEEKKQWFKDHAKPKL